MLSDVIRTQLALRGWSVADLAKALARRRATKWQSIYSTVRQAVICPERSQLRTVRDILLVFDMDLLPVVSRDAKKEGQAL